MQMYNLSFIKEEDYISFRGVNFDIQEPLDLTDLDFGFNGQSLPTRSQ
jgi:hypothetical protein